MPALPCFLLRGSDGQVTRRGSSVGPSGREVIRRGATLVATEMTTVLGAIVTGVFVLLAGNLPWAVLGGWNLRIGTAVPWAMLPMALYLWAYWRFISGGW